MAQFRGILDGNRGEASRLGTKQSGLRVEAQSWQGKAVVQLYHDAESGKDMVRVTLAQHQNGAGPYPPILLYDGPISGRN